MKNISLWFRMSVYFFLCSVKKDKWQYISLMAFARISGMSKLTFFFIEFFIGQIEKIESI